MTIFGTSSFDVNDIDISSLQLCEDGNLGNCTGPPLDWSVFDRGDPTTDLGAAMCMIDPTTGEELNYLNQDGFDDLDVAFMSQEVVDVIGCAGLNKGDPSLTLVLTATDKLRIQARRLVGSAPSSTLGSNGSIWRLTKLT